MKDSFILYTEQKAVIDKLTDAQAGQLLKALYEYVETDIVPEMDNILELVFIPFKTILDKNKEKYERVSKARADAGAKGGKQKQAKQAIANKTSNCKQNVAKQNKTSNCDDYDYDNDYDNENDYIYIIPTLDEIEEYIEKKKMNVNARDFYSYYLLNNWKDSSGKQIIWKQKLILWQNNNFKPKLDNKYHRRKYSKFGTILCEYGGE